MCVLERNREGTAKPKVGDLERHSLAVHEQIVWLEVTVKSAASMAVNQMNQSIKRCTVDRSKTLLHLSWCTDQRLNFLCLVHHQHHHLKLLGAYKLRAARGASPGPPGGTGGGQANHKRSHLLAKPRLLGRSNRRAGLHLPSKLCSRVACRERERERY